MAEVEDIFAALVAFQQEMPTVEQSATGQIGPRQYKYADLVSITKVILPLLNKHGIAYVCQPRRTDDGSYETVGSLYHVSGTHMEACLPIYGGNPQEVGKSMTYNRRYLLGSLTGVVTEEDTDAANMGHTSQTRRQTPPDPMAQAQNGVAAAWTGTGRAFEIQAVRDDYAQRYGMDLSAATVDQLIGYAKDIREAAAADNFNRSMGGVQSQELPEGAQA